MTGFPVEFIPNLLIRPDHGIRGRNDEEDGIRIEVDLEAACFHFE